MQMNLPSISENLARVLLEEHFKERMWNMDYYSWPKIYPNTAGPFLKAGGICGQAFTSFQMECYTDGDLCLVFCEGKVIEIFKTTEPFSIEYYENRRT